MTHPDPKKPLTVKQGAFCLGYKEALMDNGKITARLEELRIPGERL